MSSEWLRFVGIFQKYALSKYAGEVVTDFQTVAPGVTRTDFETCAVTYNISPSLAYALTGCTLPPSGSMVQSSDGSLTAGIFTTFDGQALSAGDHYLVVHSGVTQATIWQPKGEDTPFTLN